jgi:hypothetical protein
MGPGPRFSTAFAVFRLGQTRWQHEHACHKDLSCDVNPGRKYAEEAKGIVVSSNGRKKKATSKFAGTVEKVIKPHPNSKEPEKAQISVEGADHLYRELRVPNKLTDEDGQPVKLKEGTEVEVKIESDGMAAEKTEKPSSS